MTRSMPLSFHHLHICLQSTHCSCGRSFPVVFASMGQGWVFFVLCWQVLAKTFFRPLHVFDLTRVRCVCVWWSRGNRHSRLSTRRHPHFHFIQHFPWETSSCVVPSACASVWESRCSTNNISAWLHEGVNEVLKMPWLTQLCSTEGQPTKHRRNTHCAITHAEKAKNRNV